MEERPILMNGEMVRATLADLKTQTRRVIKPQPIYTAHDGELAFADRECHPFYKKQRGIKCPYGKPGDRLWVRETFRPAGYDLNGQVIKYRADGSTKVCDSPKSLGGTGLEHGEVWEPSIFMPRWASRITLEIVSVRVERVQEITLQDIDAEGLHQRGIYSIQRKEGLSLSGAIRWKFKELWNSINEKRGFGWEANPWVWVVEFKVI